MTRETSKLIQNPEFRFWSIIAGALVIVVLSWLPHLLTLHPSTSFGDEGMIAQLAYRINSGEVPFRDFFFTITPGTGYWTALFFKVFGSTFLALRLSTITTASIILISTIWALYRFGIKSLPTYLIVIAYLSFFGGPYWFIASHHWLSLALCLISFCLLIQKETDRIHNRSIIVAGIFAALAAFTLQHKGVLWILAATIGLLFYPKKVRKRILFSFWLGVLSIAIPLAMTFIYTCGLDVLIEQLITFPATRYNLIEGHHGTIIKDFIGSFKNISPLWRLQTSPEGWLRAITFSLGLLGKLTFIILPWIGLVSLLFLWWHKSLRKDHFGIIAAFFCAIYLSALHRPSETTLAFSATAAIIILAISIERLSKKHVGKIKAFFQNTFVYGWICCFFLAAIGFSTIELLPGKVTSALPAGSVNSQHFSQAQTLNGIASFLAQHKAPDESLFCYSYLPMFYFLMQETNPTPYDVLLYPINTQEQYSTVKILFEEKNTRWIIYDYSALWGFPFADFLRTNYVIRAKFNNVGIMERKL